MAIWDNLTNYYKFSGNSNDAVGAVNGTDANITYSNANGKIGNGAGFNGTTSNISFGNNFNFSTDFSISLWVKGDTSNNNSFISKVGSNKYQWQLDTQGPNVRFGLFTTANDATRYITAQTSSSFANTTTFYHIVITFVASSPSLKIYFNGTLDVTSTSTSGAWQTTGTNNCRMGERDFGDQFFNGAMDEFGVWSRAISANEVTQIYNNGSGVQYPNLPALISSQSISLLGIQ